MSRDPFANDAVEPERYEFDEEPRYRFELSRRAFMQVLGAGALITVKGGTAFAQPHGLGRGREGTVAARVHVGADGTITVMTSKVEAGQGARTEITQAAAEELRVTADQIQLLMADTDFVPEDGGTFGSRTTPSTIPDVRRGAAAAREILVNAACKSWGVEPDAVKAENGVIVHSASNRTVTYADLARSEELAEAFKRDVPDDIEVMPVREWKVMGTSVRRSNARDIVTGTHRHPSDIVRPNMLYGKVLRPPSYGATLASIDLGPAEEMEDVVVVRDGQFVGCAAPTSLRAQQAVDAIAKTARWDTEPHPSSRELFTYLKAHAQSGEGGGWRSRGGRTEGSVEEGLAKADKVQRATYEIAYIQHAPMEPRAAVAEWNDGKLTVWTGTQRPHGHQGQLCEAFALPAERVRVIVPDTGGGFGGKHTPDAALEAARLAKAAGRPVSVRWTREEEFTWAYFRPAGVIDVAAGLDANGSLTAWEFTNYNSGGSALDSPYITSNLKEQVVGCESPLREGSYRCLAATANNFAREAFMDELAAQAGADPLEFRLAHLDDDRLRAVLESAAERFGWSERKARTSSNKGIGLACGAEKGSYVAACAEVSIDRNTGRITLDHLCQVFECGAVQNPANLLSQIEGCIIMGLGAALREEIRFENGKILNPRFSQYRVPRFKDVPTLDIHMLDRPDLRSVGAGETPIIVVAPAIANAVLQATGHPLRSLPFRADEIEEA